MLKITEILSNRELALLIWLFIFLIVSLFIKGVRDGLLQTAKIIFSGQIAIIFGGLLIYTTTITLILYYFGFWKLTHFKDTAFWFFSFAIVVFFSINKVKDNQYFKNVIKDCLKWTLFVEFLINFYTFSLKVEIFVIPVAIFFGLLQAVAQTKEKYKPAEKLFTAILTIIAAGTFLFSLFKTITDLQNFFTVNTLVVFILPPLLSVLSLPFFYCLALYMNYEEFFVRVDCMFNDAGMKKVVKTETLLHAKLNLEKLISIKEKFKKFDLYQIKDARLYIKELVKVKN